MHPLIIEKIPIPVIFSVRGIPLTKLYSVLSTMVITNQRITAQAMAIPTIMRKIMTFKKPPGAYKETNPASDTKLQYRCNKD